MYTTSNKVYEMFLERAKPLPTDESMTSLNIPTKLDLDSHEINYKMQNLTGAC